MSTNCKTLLFATPFAARRREKSKFSAENYASRANNRVLRFAYLRHQRAQLAGFFLQIGFQAGDLAICFGNIAANR